MTFICKTFETCTSISIPIERYEKTYINAILNEASTIIKTWITDYGIICNLQCLFVQKCYNYRRNSVQNPILVNFLRSIQQTNWFLRFCKKVGR